MNRTDAETVAVIALRLLRGLDDDRMIRQPEVIVRGEHDDLAQPLDLDDRSLRPLQQQLTLQRAGSGHLVQFGGERIEEMSWVG